METQLYKKIQASSPLDLTGTANTRDLGGYPTAGGLTRHGQFYRSDGLQNLTPEDIRRLVDLDIRCVVDLRSEYEVKKSPPPLGEAQGITYVHIPMLDQAASAGFAQALPDSMGKVYLELLSQSGESFAQVMACFARHADHGILFHCTAGKDRTGVTAMLLLSLCGVPREYILEDYLVSEENMKVLFNRQKADFEKAFGKVLPASVFSSAPQEMELALDYLASTYGTAEAYLLQQGVPPATLSRIREKLLPTP